ncbi:endonuclease exonuclease phosphatase domain containing protein [Plakobranchus ocellatus]|uniref:Endonuclease exonuclease phosphatase domain containing protein n=1 Tax=Plakobranchus ocellatus TaxID=259542 RepID=A0AAV4D7G3_9GAST|nr:endonuclease exonuclease phosphatase domain containing protein [Plakobranchus ocellatus]
MGSTLSLSIGEPGVGCCLFLAYGITRDSHVQQVAPGRHPASARKIKTDKTSKIATWNVRTLHQKGKLENVVKDMAGMKLNILGLAEVRWTGADSMKLGSKTLIYSGGHTHERGVDILFDVTTAKNLGKWCPISDRAVVGKLVAKPLNLGIIQVYALTYIRLTENRYEWRNMIANVCSRQGT